MTLDAPLPYKSEARDEFLLFQPGKVVNVTVNGGRFSLAGITYTCEGAQAFNGQEITVKILYSYDSKQFFALQRLENGDFLIYNEKRPKKEGF
jgi:hypothetical protein